MKIVAYDAAGKEHRFSRLAAVETDWRCGSPAGSIAARILADALPPGLVSLRWYAAGGELLFEGVVDAARLVTGPEGRTPVSGWTHAGAQNSRSSAAPSRASTSLTVTRAFRGISSGSARSA